eukprot:403343451
MLHSHSQNREIPEWKVKSKYLLNEVCSYIGCQMKVKRTLHSINKEFRNVLITNQSQINKRIFPEYRQKLDFSFEIANQIQIEKVFPTLNIIQQPLVITELKISNPMILLMTDKVFQHNQNLTIQSISIQQKDSSVMKELSKKTSSFLQKYVEKYHTSSLRIESLQTDLSQFLYDVLIKNSNKFSQLYVNGLLLTFETLKNLSEIKFKLPRQLNMFETMLFPRTCCEVLDLIEEDHQINLKLRMYSFDSESFCNQILGKMRTKRILNLYIVFGETYLKELDTFQIIQQLAEGLYSDSEQNFQSFQSLTLSHLNFQNLNFDFDEFINLLKYVNYKPHRKDPVYITYLDDQQNHQNNILFLLKRLAKEGLIRNAKFVDMDYDHQLKEKKFEDGFVKSIFRQQNYRVWNQSLNEGSLFERPKQYTDFENIIREYSWFQVKFSPLIRSPNFTQISHLIVMQIDEFFPYLSSFTHLRCFKYEKPCTLERLIDALKRLNLLNLEQLTVNYKIKEEDENLLDHVDLSQIQMENQNQFEETDLIKQKSIVLEEEFFQQLVKAQNLIKIQYLKRPNHTFEEELSYLTTNFKKLEKIELIQVCPELLKSIEKLEIQEIERENDKNDRKNNIIIVSSQTIKQSLDFLIQQLREKSKIDLKEINSILNQYVETERAFSNRNLFRKIQLKFNIPRPLDLAEYLESIGETKMKYLIDIPFKSQNYKETADYFKQIGMMNN